MIFCVKTQEWQWQNSQLFLNGQMHMRRKRWIHVFAICMSLIMMILVVEPVRATTISDLEKEKKELEKQKEEAKNKQSEQQEKLNSITGEIDTMQDEADVVAEEIEETDAALVETIASVTLIEEDIEEKETQIEETTVEYEAALATEQAQYEAMKLRIKFLYEKGDSTYLQLLLESQSFSDMVNKAEYIEKIEKYDRDMLEEYQLAREETQTIKEQLEEEKSELEAQQHELEEEKANLETMLAEKQAAYEDYELLLAKAKQEAAVYKANVEKQNAEIRRLEAAASQKQSQIDEAKKAQEEASKKTSSGSYNSAASYSGSGSTGQQVASYACQFVGNPYVTGGTSLTQGADCSGFTWRIYKDFGYSIPRTSYAQRTAGTGVSYSEAQPGDIICYAGHVGLYIGNGQIVHASTAKTGIKISRATYREILAVRRIV